MPQFNELWDWLAYVRESNAYLIALPSFVALFLACIADWVERYLIGPSEAPSGEQEPKPLREVVTRKDHVHPAMQRQLSSRSSLARGRL
jgi:hypothetical protein